jgi:hypothetical protein
MMSEMTEEEFWAIFQAHAQEPQPEIEYRLYYDENGLPLFYSTEQVPGMYILIDQETFLNGPTHIKVIDGKIIEAEICWTKKIVPSTQGTACHPLDVSVVVADDQPAQRWQLQHKDNQYDQTH